MFQNLAKRTICCRSIREPSMQEQRRKRRQRSLMEKADSRMNSSSIDMQNPKRRSRSRRSTKRRKKRLKTPRSSSGRPSSGRPKRSRPKNSRDSTAIRFKDGKSKKNEGEIIEKEISQSKTLSEKLKEHTPLDDPMDSHETHKSRGSRGSRGSINLMDSPRNKKKIDHASLVVSQRTKYQGSEAHLDQGSIREPKIFICIPKKKRLKMETILEHLAVQILVSVLVLIDGILLGITFFTDDEEKKEHLNIGSRVILFLLMVENLARFVYKDIYFFKHPWCVFDFVIIGCAVVFDVFLDGRLRETAKAVVFLRPLRLIRVVVNLVRTKQRVTLSSKKTVGGTRRRYQKDGFDLDISFITPTLMAMSVPAVGGESIYRNSCDEVARFFKKKYNGRFHIYNLVPERKYPYEKFNNHVYEFFMEDHNPAPLPLIIDFCHHIHEWIGGENRQAHVAAVHCKGGKGRTGTMICSYLLYSKYEAILDSTKPDEKHVIETAEDSLSYFAYRRTKEGAKDSSEGVEARSQTRYVGYMAKLVRHVRHKNKPISELEAPDGPKMVITKIRVVGITAILDGPGIPTWVVRDGSQGFPTTVYKGYRQDCKKHRDPENDSADFIPSHPIVVKDDVQIAFFVESKKDLLFGYWWHTYFERRVQKREVDERTGAVANHFIMEFNYATTDGIRWAIKKPEYKNLFPHYFRSTIHFKK